MTQSRQLGISWLVARYCSLLQRCQLSDYLGFLWKDFLARGAYFLVRLFTQTGRKSERSTATHGASKPIASDGAGAEGHWRFLLSLFLYVN